MRARTWIGVVCGGAVLAGVIALWGTRQEVAWIEAERAALADAIAKLKQAGVQLAAKTVEAERKRDEIERALAGLQKPVTAPKPASSLADPPPPAPRTMREVIADDPKLEAMSLQRDRLLMQVEFAAYYRLAGLTREQIAA
ncbi:MAG: hypothetical protein V4773_31175, partial [Verrucomicrobiota bacterium]